MIDPSLKNQNESNYINMINYLISSLNKAKSATIPNQLHNKPIFLYEFFVFELYLPRELIRKIKQPLLAFRLLDFPTLTIQGNIAYGKESIVFNQGKSSYFEMEVSELRESLVNQPMYIMFVDLNHGDTKVIASSRLNISIFSYDSFLQYSGDTPKPRRNILKLFDNALQKVAEFEMSLLIRREYYKYEINSFPLNQEKIFVNNNHLDNKYATSNSNEHRFNEETMKKGTYDRPYSNDLRMKSTDDIMKSDHIRMNVEEKTKKEFNENLQKVDSQTQSNFGPNIENQNTMNTNYQTNINNQYNLKQSNFPTSDFSVGGTYQPSLKELLNSNERNPPPLYFHNKKVDDTTNEKVIRIIHEERKTDNDNLNSSENVKILSESGVQTDDLYKLQTKSQNLEFYQPKEKKFYMKRKKTNQELVNEMYTKSKQRYDNYMKSLQSTASSGQIKPNSTSELPKKKKINQNKQSSIHESIKIEENLNESDNDSPNQTEEKNEYLKLYNKVQTSGMKSIEKNKQSVSIQEKIEGGENTEEYGYNDFDKNASQIPYEESSIKMQKVSNDNLFVSVIEKTSLENNEYNKQKRNLKKSVTASQLSMANDSMIKSVIESVNGSKDKDNPSPIKESSEAVYDDFEHSGNQHTLNNKSQEIPEDNLIKKKSTHSIHEEILSHNTTNEIKEEVNDNNTNRKDSIQEEIFSENKFNSINHQSTLSKGNETNEIEEFLFNSDNKN